MSTLTNGWGTHSQQELVGIHYFISKVHNQVWVSLRNIEDLAHKVQKQIMPSGACKFTALVKIIRPSMSTNSTL